MTGRDVTTAADRAPHPGNRLRKLHTSEAALTLYAFEGRSLRTLDRDGEPWFIAGDAAAFLGHRDAADLNRGLDDDEKGTHSVRTLGGEQKVSVISEAGLYRAIVQRRATSAITAETREFIARFQRWVFHDVLPSIRRAGTFASSVGEGARTNDAADARKTREARLLHKYLLGVGKMAGLAGNQLLIAANRATTKETGFDVLGSMGITHLIAPVNDPLVIPSKLGMDLGLGKNQGRRVNTLLLEEGLQERTEDRDGSCIWRPTAKGAALGGQLVDVERNNGTGADQQLKWPLAATLEVLRAAMGAAAPREGGDA